MSSATTEMVEPETPDGEPASLKVEAYSTPELAKMFQVTVDTVRQWIRDKKIKAFKGANGRWYVQREDAVEYANNRWGPPRDR